MAFSEPLGRFEQLTLVSWRRTLLDLFTDSLDLLFDLMISLLLVVLDEFHLAHLRGVHALLLLPAALLLLLGLLDFFFLRCECGLLCLNRLLPLVLGVFHVSFLSFVGSHGCTLSFFFLLTDLLSDDFLLLDDPVVLDLMERFKFLFFVIVHEEGPHQTIVRIFIESETADIPHVFNEAFRQVLAEFFELYLLLELLDLPEAIVRVVDKIAPGQTAFR